MSFKVSICAICGSAVAAPAKVCYGCETAVTADTIPARGITVGGPVLSVRDFTALERFARLRLSPSGPVYASVLSKLEQSRMLPVDAVMPDIAALGSRVIFSVDDGPAEGRMIVLPPLHSPAGWTLPATSPRGLALLGHAPGAVVVAIRRDGASETLHLSAVTHEPDGAGSGNAVGDRRAAERAGTDTSSWPGLRRIRPRAPGRFLWSDDPDRSDARSGSAGWSWFAGTDSRKG